MRPLLLSISILLFSGQILSAQDSTKTRYFGDISRNGISVGAATMLQEDYFDRYKNVSYAEVNWHLEIPFKKNGRFSILALPGIGLTQYYESVYDGRFALLKTESRIVGHFQVPVCVQFISKANKGLVASAGFMPMFGNKGLQSIMDFIGPRAGIGYAFPLQASSLRFEVFVQDRFLNFGDNSDSYRPGKHQYGGLKLAMVW